MGAATVPGEAAMTVCHLWTEPDHALDRCAWCLQPYDRHRFVPCGTCHGWQRIPSPAGHTPGPRWARSQVPCPRCDTGWTVRATGRPARDHELAPVLRREPAE